MITRDPDWRFVLTQHELAQALLDHVQATRGQKLPVRLAVSVNIVPGGDTELLVWEVQEK